jgi:hypothetical protein
MELTKILSLLREIALSQAIARRTIAVNMICRRRRHAAAAFPSSVASLVAGDRDDPRRLDAEALT